MDYRRDHRVRFSGVFLLVISALILLVSPAALAALDGTLYIVDSLEDTVAADGFLTLREAVEASNSNAAVNEAPAGSATETDVIIFDPELLEGEIELADTLEITGDLYIEGSADNPLEITCGDEHVFLWVNGSNASLEMSGIRFTGSTNCCIFVDNLALVDLSYCVFESNASCVSVDNSDLSVYSCEFTGNTSDDSLSFAIHAVSSQLDISRCIFSQNTNTRSGGAISMNACLAFITECDFKGNSSDRDGGAMSIRESFAYIAECNFTGNSCDQKGGAMEITHDSDVMISECSFIENSSSSGSAIECDSSELTIKYSEFDSNVEEYEHGCICADSSDLTISYTFLRNNNTAGLYYDGDAESFLNMSSCVVAGNLAGGVELKGENCRLTNCTIAGNSGRAGIKGDPDRVVLTNCIVSDNYIGQSGDYVQEDVEIFSSVIMINSLYSMDVGFVRRPSAGPDETWGTDDDDLGDLHLRPDSPAVNIGDEDLRVTAYDIEGNRWDSDHYESVGAYTFIGEATGQFETPSATVTTADDVIDFNDNLISLREAIMYSVQKGRNINFDPSLDGQAISLTHGPLGIAGSFEIKAGSLDITIYASSQAFVVVGRPGEHHELDLQGITITGASRSAIIANNADLTIEDCSIIDNRGVFGGAISFILSDEGAAVDLKIINSDLSGNEATYGGAICFIQSVENAIYDLEIRNSYMAGNEATYGGAVYCSYYDWGDMLLINNVMVGNIAEGNGGAVYIDCQKTGMLVNSEFKMINNTVAGNFVEADHSGVVGGVYCGHSESYIYNSIITQNYAGQTPSDLLGDFERANCIIGQDAQFVRDPYIGDDGRWGTADDDFGDLRLDASSPAIDTGYTYYYMSNSIEPDVDMSGNPRTVGQSIDIGAYENQNGGLIADIDGNGVVNILDFLVLRANYGTASGATHATGDLDSDGDVDMHDFLIFRSFYNI